MPSNIPIPVLSTVTFDNFLTDATSTSTSMNQSDKFLFVNSGGHLRKIGLENLTIGADNYKGYLATSG